MSGTTIGPTMHERTEISLDAQFQIRKKDGKYYLPPSLIKGEDPTLVERLRSFLAQLTAELNDGTKEQI